MTVVRPFLRDGIDVYVRGDDEVHFVFLATRKRITVKVKSFLIHSLAWLDGKEDMALLTERMLRLHGTDARDQFIGLLAYLERQGIVIEPDWLAHTGLDESTLAIQQRQLSFFLDVLGSPEKAAEAQMRISEARLVCFGVGAVGSWLLRLLLSMGFKHFVLIDHDHLEESDVTRHAFFSASGFANVTSKSADTANRIREQFGGVDVVVNNEPLTVNSELDTLISPSTDLVINAADEPYIGYTSVLLSRFCVPRNIPLLVAGGFNAHLGSLGELIVPGVTPCADCYADYFQDALKDWQPVEHPVADRQNAVGGLCSLSVFAAGSAAMKALRYFTLKDGAEGGRGELLFHDYQLDAFEVERRPDCHICSTI